MIPVKIIQAYKKAIENLNRSIEKEIDTFEIDYDKVVQNFVCFLGDTQCDVNIVKHFDKYVYDIKLFDYKSAEFLFDAVFTLDIYTGKSKIIEINQLLTLK